MRPFISFFGGKWASASRYPAPTHDTIIEPFAGSAGYSVRHYERRVLLIDADPVISGVWRFLIHATPEDIYAIPDVPVGGTVDDLDICQEAKWLVGFWLNKGHPTPCKSPSAWMRDPRYSGQFWGERIRERIAGQVEKIKHWEVLPGDYRKAPDVRATWFVDPPYVDQGRRYRVSLTKDNYPAVAEFCRTRRGQVIACEQDGASWLPFQSIGRVKATSKRHGGLSHECVWLGPSPTGEVKL